MATRVRFRYNKLSGEVEEFLVDDQNQNLSEAEHDRIATEVGRVLARRPLIHELQPGSANPSHSRPQPIPTPSQAETPQTQPTQSERT